MVRGNALPVVAVREVTIVVTTSVITASSPQCHPDIRHRFVLIPDLPLLCHNGLQRRQLHVFRPSLVVRHSDVCKPHHNILGHICLAQRRGCVFTYLELVAREDTDVSPQGVPRNSEVIRYVILNSQNLIT